jgi:hypothetical protein
MVIVTLQRGSFKGAKLPTRSGSSTRKRSTPSHQASPPYNPLVRGQELPGEVSTFFYSGFAMSVQKFIFFSGIFLSGRNPADKKMWGQKIFAPLLAPLS